MSAYGNQVCKQCETVHFYLKYGLCERCFDKWEHKDNPEPEARKVRLFDRSSIDGADNRKGHFVVRIKTDLYFSSRKNFPVPLSEATDYTWLNTARAIAEMCKGKVQELKPDASEVE